MTITEKYDKALTGVISGILLPLIVALCIYLFTSGGISFSGYVSQLSESNIITHTISLSVFPNVIIFLVFNRFDMLRACRGVLAVTIIWAVIVFLVKFFG